MDENNIPAMMKFRSSQNLKPLLGVVLCTRALVVLILNLPLATGSPHSIFSQFETLKPHQMSIREERTASGIHLGAVTASFYAFQKRFTLSLTPGMRVLHPDLRAELVDSAGTARPYNIRSSSKFYSGTVEGDVTQEVEASQSDGVWMIHIHTPGEFYAVEPLRFYDGKAGHQDMIVYRTGDIKQDNRTDRRPFCKEFSFKRPAENPIDGPTGSPHTLWMPGMVGIIWNSRHPPNTNPTFDSIKDEQKQQQHVPTEVSKDTAREKRSSWRDKGYSNRATDCDVIAVTDYSLFRGIGGRNPAAIVQTLVHAYSLVDRIFRETDFGAGYGGGYGIVLRGVTIHTSFSDSVGHYNSNNASMTAHDLLAAMAGHAAFTDYCLAHLSVQRGMGEILGLAAVAAPEDYWASGACAGMRDAYARNVGVSTMVDAAGLIMPLKHYSIVIAHEMGHNWGARHDPGDGSHFWSCQSDSSAGGKFLMWPYSGLKKDPTSVKFSPCSIKDIRDILRTRAHRCFLQAHFRHDFCGNGLLEQAEECDPGFAFLDTDPCCASDCRLRAGAQCSFRNAPCCTESCQAAPSTHKCYPKGTVQPCYESSNCLGHDAMQCPPPTPRPNGAPCGQNGSCHYGRCMSFCEKIGLAKHPVRDFRSCECGGNRTSMCRFCCVDKGVLGATCQVMGPPKEDGTACVSGRCLQGICLEKELAPEVLASKDNHRLPLEGLRESAAVTAQALHNHLGPLLLYCVIVLILA